MNKDKSIAGPGDRFVNMCRYSLPVKMFQMMSRVLFNSLMLARKDESISERKPLTSQNSSTAEHGFFCLVLSLENTGERCRTFLLVFHWGRFA